MEQLTLPAASRAQGHITLPGSKSISNRTLLLAALADGVTEIRDVLASDDTARMLEALAILGVKCENFAENAWRVTGCNGQFPNKQADLFLGNAGTAFRPLTAALALSNGHYTLTGTPRMHERPIGDLNDALRQIGAHIECLDNEGFPPLKIKPQISPAHLPPPQPSPLKVEGVTGRQKTTDKAYAPLLKSIATLKPIQIRGDVSSQFLTALLMALPLTKQEATIEVIGELISKPYIEITLNLMAKFGVAVKRDGWQRFTIAANAQYTSPKQIFVEGDASSASYFLAAGAIGGGPVNVKGVGQNSIQGDIKFTEALEMMGAEILLGQNFAECERRDYSADGTHHTTIKVKSKTKLKAIDLDCNHMPDAAMTLATTALFCDGTTTLRNIASWRVKETDRLSAMATELRKVGAIVTEGIDFISITPPVALTPNAVIDTYDDHRMAMCFALVSLGGVPITINDPKCVNKTFPDFFPRFAKITK
ncbi:MAG: 3-phosphoshikimate 1-carboxyvinyltransferase [Bdellovibrio sp.]|nr:3-phosphoshikimate 1-carboxyvinyltransferase [Methylotenera sp.]